MSVIIQGFQLRVGAYGVQLVKGPLVLPATATSTLYTVSGGSVMVTSLLGLVTTATTATATNLSLGTVPTTGTSSATGIASATAVTSREAGTWLSVLNSAGTGGALVVGTNGGSALFVTTPFIIPAGTITWTTSATNTGQIKWYLTYVPLDNGATVS